MQLAKLREKLTAEYAGDEGLPTSLCVLDYIAELPDEELRHLRLHSLAEGIGRSIDHLLLRAIAILVAGTVSVLETHLELIDDDDDPIEIEKSELTKAQETGSLVHPVNGKLIKDFESKIYPYFVPTKTFVLARNDG